ncbi:MAG: elongation factor G [Eubacterium sp.]
MKVYKTADIRNVVFMGHGGSGKTTLAEALAFVTGAVSRQGKVTDGTTISDFDKEEIKRKFSISSTVIPIEYNGLKINILDAPGYFDFVGQMEEAMSVADAAVIVVNAKSGIEVGTMKAWNICERRKIPRLFFITGMDDPNANYLDVVEDLKKLYGKKIAPFHLPIKESDKLVGFVNVVKMGGRKFIENGKYVECDIPDSVKDELLPVREMINEAVAETDEELMNKYFEGEDFTQEEISLALRKSVIECDIVPVQMGAGINAQGAETLLQAIDKYFPSPEKAEVFKKGTNVKTGEEVEADKDITKPVSAYVFKTIMDPFIGKFSLVKVCTGILHSDDVVYNAEKDVEEKLSKLYIMTGKKTSDISELYAGDIGAIGKLTSTRTGDTLSTKAWPIKYHPTTMSKPYTYKAYKAVNKGEEDKISQALTKLCIEDLTLKTVNDEENRQSLLYGIGDQQLDVAVSKLLDKYKVSIELFKPKFPFRETIRKKVQNVQGKHKKQSGGAGQFGEIYVDFEPSGDLETPYVFEEKIVGGSVPKNFFPAVEKGIAESVLKGPVAGYPVVGVKMTLIDGKYHPVDSNEMAFKMASIKAFKEAMLQASPVLLEPIASVKVSVPEKFTGDVMGDLNKRRGRVLGMSPADTGITLIEADVPMSELYGYSTILRSITGGMGEFEYEFSRYEQAPSDVQAREIAEKQKTAE